MLTDLLTLFRVQENYRIDVKSSLTMAPEDFQFNRTTYSLNDDFTKSMYELKLVNTIMPLALKR